MKLKLFKDENPTKDELYVRDIVIEHLKNPHVTKEIEPSTDLYNLTNESNGVWIRLGHSDIRITNHEFFYQKTFTLKFIERLKSMVKAKIREEQQGTEEQVKYNEMELLRRIFKTVELND